MGFGKMFRAVAALLWVIVIPGAGIAQGTLPDVVPNKPISGDPLIDYRIEACSGTYGFGPYLYAPSDHIIRFSDFCLLEDQGVALAAEELSGLTLTKDGPNFRLFEDFPSGDERYARNNVSFLFGEGTEECESSEPRNAFEYTIPNADALRDFKETGFGWQEGYVIGETAARPRADEARVLLWIMRFSQSEMATRTLESYELGEDGGLWASIRFGDAGGTVEIDTGFGDHYGKADGGLSITYNGDGSFSATGRFSADSSRVAGHGPTDMVSISGEIPFMRGHFLGADGSRISGYGLVIGTFRTAGGQTHPFRAVASLEGCAVEDAVAAEDAPDTEELVSEGDAQASPDAVLERFTKTCTQVLGDPDAYLAGIETPGPAGERVTSVSPDKKLVSVYARDGTTYDEVELHIVGNRQVRDCSVIGEFHGADTEELAGQFRQMVESREGLTISGGHAPQDYVDGGALTTEEDIYLYAIDGLWPELGLIATAHVIAGELQLYVQRTMN
ncbi:hypothetical protein [Roseovarius indicus]|uniref:Uncharacterized protein n=1 Tax=Roseovarius indicus TaxID=540747 RepID=A0A0T5PDB7_9RHOB|nr:hypothetical protein [Roseovarius indicus]KRS19057.1 hypothetical protein XM52_05170 [Roseovarius indicus]QEW25996.1 hypothetical protein RIdsm_01790 [Roseovarius indicus]SFD91601.1 hypothetical protein SAMN04488031_103203 [Roseovarius indicus]